MAGKFLDSYDLPITCPKCSNEFNKKVRELNTNPNIACPSCGQLITVDMKKINREIKKMEESVKKAGFRLR
ncbi:MAG TPA: hypothetical protein DCK95_06910 [Anaerolineaceae bacterium]|nr:hypothetical protein [Anaerolineaceae bacterium]